MKILMKIILIMKCVIMCVWNNINNINEILMKW